MYQNVSMKLVSRLNVDRVVRDVAAGDRAIDNEGKNSVFYAALDWKLQKLKNAGADFNVADNTRMMAL